MPVSSAVLALAASSPAKSLAEASTVLDPDALRQRSALLPNQLQFLSGKVHAGKGFTAESGVFVPDRLIFPQEVEPWSTTPADLAEAIEQIKAAERDARRPILVLGCPIVDGPNSAAVRERFASSGGFLTRTKHNDSSKGQIACFSEVARHLYVIDFDPTTAQKKWCESRGLDVFSNPEGAVRACVEQFFPPEVRRCSYAYQLSSSCGLSSGARKTLEAHHVKFHLFMWLRKPQYPDVVKAWVAEQCARNAADGFAETKKNRHVAGGLDLALYQAVQPHFISVRFSGCADPLAGIRWGLVPGETDTLELVLTDGKNGELSFAPDKGSSTYTTAAVQIGRGASVRRISWAAINDGDLSKWPSGYKARLALIEQRGTHVTVFHASRSLGWHLVSTHGDAEKAKSSDDFRKVVQEFFDAIDAKPRSDTSPERIAHHRREALEHINEGIDRAAAIIAERKARRRRVAPHFANEEVSLSQAEGQMQTIVDAFYSSAWRRTQFARGFEPACERARKHAANKNLALPGDWITESEFVGVPRQIIAATAGAGKTHASLLSYLKSGLAPTTRLYYFVPTHKKASELKADFDQLASELGISVSASICSGLSRACLARKKDKARYDAATACADVGISPKATACADCPFSHKCSWIKQADDRTPGLKIVPTAYLGFVIPGFAKTKESDPPILGIVIDEDFVQSLKMQRTAIRKDVPIYSDFQLKWPERDGQDGRDLLRDDDKWSLSETANAVRKLFDHEGPLNFERFDALVAEHARRRGIVAICDLLKNYVWEVRKLVAARVREDLKAGRNVGLEARDTLRRVTFLNELLQMMRTVRFARRDLDATAACKVEHTNNGANMHLFWYRRLHPTLASLPLLYLDATTELELAKLPFQQWDDILNEDVDLNVDYAKIDIAAPHQKLVKVINAPVGKRRFDETGTEWRDVKSPRAKSKRKTATADQERESDRTAGKTRVPKRLHNNAAWAEVFRFAEAVCGRAITDGHEAGLISYKGAEAYSKKFGFCKGANLGHFGNLRGVNAWERCRVLVTIGRTVPVDSELENEAEARFVLDRHGRRPARGLGIKHVSKAVRIVKDRDNGPNGVTVEVEEPACPFVAMVYRAVTAAEVAQAIGRARGVRRTVETEVLVLEVSPVLLNATYAAILDWRAFAGLSEIDAVLHSQGVVPIRKPGHLKNLAPWCFSAVEQSKDDLSERSRQMFERAGWMKRNEIGHFMGNDLYKEFSLYIGDSPENDRIRYAWPNFSSETVIYGEPSAHKLLKPAVPALETYRAKHAQDSLSCVVDSSRREAAAAALMRATGCTLGPSARGAPRRALPSPAAIRMRALRERKKAGLHRQPQRRSRRNAKIGSVSRRKAA